jgi:exonuclease III
MTYILRRIRHQKLLCFELPMIVQWNLNSIRTRWEDLHNLICDMEPEIICLQETRTNETPTIRGYQGFFKSENARLHGVAIYTKNNINATEIDIQTPLKAIAVRCGLNKEVSVVSIYIPPHDPVDSLEEDLEELLNQLPTPVVITGDFNAHHTTWGKITMISQEEEPS